MYKPVSFNGRIVGPDDALVVSSSAGALYGKGVFTTVAVRKRSVFLWDLHLKRLLRDSGSLGIEFTQIEAGTLREDLEELIGRNEVIDGKARITVFDDSLPEIWSGGERRGPSVLIQTKDTTTAERALTMSVSPFRVSSASPLRGIKSCNYLDPILAFNEAQKRGFGEALRLNEKDRVVSGCLSNIFWKSRHSGKIRTPALAEGCLPGTTREYVIDAIEVEQVEFSLDEFKTDAQSIFVTSAVRGITAVEFFEGVEDLKKPGDDILSLIPNDG